MTEVPQEHSSLVGGSTAARRIACPASWAYEQMVPKSPGSSYAREGTALHEMIAQVLDHDKDPAEMLPFTHNQPAKHGEEPWSLTVDEDLWAELGEPALQALDDFIDEVELETGGTFEFMIEKSCAFPGLLGAFGTSDVVWKCGYLAGILDWKFGRGYVNVIGNKQMRFYLSSALSDFPAFFAGVTSFRIGIIQPRCSDEVMHEDLDFADLAEYEVLLRKRVGEAQELGIKADCEKGDHCTFADCKAVCPHFLGAVSTLGNLLATMELHDEAVRKNPEAAKSNFDYPAFLAEAMELAPDVEAWGKKIAAMAQERIDAGGSVEGWKTVDKKSSGRDWTMEEPKIISRLRSRGLMIDDYAPRKLVTAPAAEKLLKKIGKELPEEMFKKKVSSGTTLVREGDPRPSARRPTDVTAGLAAALAAKVADATE